MNYTREDYIILEKAQKDMKKLIKYFEKLIATLEIQCESFDEDKKLILKRVYDLVSTRKEFAITNYREECYIDIAYNNLVLSVYSNIDNNVYIGEQFEVWNDSKCYCIGTLTVGEIKNILEIRRG